MRYTELPTISAAGEEGPMLQEFLKFQRVVVKRKAEGLRDEDLRARLTGHPSSLTIGGILKHLSWVEVKWSQAVMAGKPYDSIAEPWSSHRGTDSNWEWNLESESALEIVSLLDKATELADRVYDSADGLDQLSARAGSDDPIPDEDAPRYALRWILLHLIEEYSRHAGHMDLLREQIDGNTGD